ncbi:MAG: hypothetical protein JW959_07430 [Pirellulales bacterium]|nr:hypothetical protein [Pirellulales bacterium]
MDDDKKQRHVNFTIIAFCGTVMIFMILFWLFSSFLGFWHFFTAILLGALVGGATFAVCHVLEL